MLEAAISKAYSFRLEVSIGVAKDRCACLRLCWLWLELDAMKQVVYALNQEGVDFTVYERTMVEPKDSSIREAIDFSKAHGPDAFLAVGGGSVQSSVLP